MGPLVVVLIEEVIEVFLEHFNVRVNPFAEDDTLEPVEHD